MDKSLWVILGIFAGLIVLIQILKAVRANQDKLEAEVAAAAPVSAPVINNRAELAAVVASCIAEVMGKDVSGLRIVSIKQI